ncbi:MAG: mannitol dehydrogenase family protein [Solirubrobacteraceae bacterium]
MTGLGSATARLTRRGLGGRRPVPADAPAQAGIVHLGLGSFHRAHQAIYTARALEREAGPWGIAGVAHRSRRVTDALRAQDGLYCVLELGGAELAPLVVGVHTELLVAADAPGAVVARLADPGTRIATLTVTEQGYTAGAGTGGLDTELAAVRADLGGAPPSTTIGLLARGLQQRWRGHGEPMAIVSCDNVGRNGEHTRALVLEFVGLLPEPDAAELRGWIERSIAFPSTMVDRIVPATRPEHRVRAAELLGLDDAAPVVAEPFHMWVLEDRFPGGRPRWEAAGAIFSDEVERYEQLKLRLLNATHSLIAYLGLLAGEPSIARAIARPEIRAAAEHVIHDELRPTLDAPAGVDVPRYVDELFARFANAALDHRACQVASDGSAKLPARITGAVLHHTGRGVVPRALALTVAAYVRCLATPGAYDAARLGATADPQRDRLEELGRRARDSRELVEAVFELGIFAPAVAQATPFVDAIAELHAVLVAHGHGAAIEAAIG